MTEGRREGRRRGEGLAEGAPRTHATAAHAATVTITGSLRAPVLILDRSDCACAPALLSASPVAFASSSKLPPPRRRSAGGRTWASAVGRIEWACFEECSVSTVDLALVFFITSSKKIQSVQSIKC